MKYLPLVGRMTGEPSGSSGESGTRAPGEASTEIERWASEAIPGGVEGLVITADGEPVRLSPTDSESDVVRTPVDELIRKRKEYISD